MRGGPSQSTRAPGSASTRAVLEVVTSCTAEAPTTTRRVASWASAPDA
ncbi:MAG: hypothetical protein IPN17_20240 [Deltaproteobacteria bacterium]|nr:hypothetical protein [Deltaproteobacteria bacterium]